MDKHAAVLDECLARWRNTASRSCHAVAEQSFVFFEVSGGNILRIFRKSTRGRRCHEHEAGFAPIFQCKGPDMEAAGQMELQAGDIVRPDGRKGEVSAGVFGDPEVLPQKSACKPVASAVGTYEDGFGMANSLQGCACEAGFKTEVLSIAMGRIADDAYPGELLMLIEGQQYVPATGNDGDVEVRIVDGEHLTAGERGFHGLFKGDEGFDVRDVRSSEGKGFHSAISTGSVLEPNASMRL